MATHTDLDRNVPLMLEISSQIILMTRRLSLGTEAVADCLVSILARPLVALQAKGRKLKSACHSVRLAILVLIWSLVGLIHITDACASQLQNSEANSQSWRGASNVWKGREYESKEVAGTILAATSMTIGAIVAVSWMYSLIRSLVKTTPAEIVPEIEAISVAVQAALPEIPVVEGDDLDGVLAKAPIPTISNSPLSWLLDLVVVVVV